MPHKPWPLVPRPFADEAFGSWFGRIAAAYRMGVDELANIADLPLDFGQDCRSWLLLPRPPPEACGRLAAMSRLAMDCWPVSQGLLPPRVRRSRYDYCYECLCLNPLDVTAPYWKAKWLVSNSGCCDVHETHFDHVHGTALRGCRNLDRLLTYISRQHRRRRIAQDWQSFQRR